MLEFFMFAGAVYMVFRTNIFFKASPQVASFVRATWGNDAARASDAFGIPVSIILADICVESAGKPDARSPVVGARGLMQMTPDALTDSNRYAGTSYTFDDMFNGTVCIMAGTAYMAWLREQFSGDIALAIQAYEGGIGNVRRDPSKAAWYRDRVFAYQSVLLNT